MEQVNHTARGRSADLILRVEALSKSYGGITAVDELTFSMEKGSILGVVGPNGAGKSTLISLLGGAVAPSAGEIVFDGADISRDDAASRARAGIGRTYQIPRPFLGMTVVDNLLVPLFAREPFGNAAGIRERAHAVLTRCGLADVAHWKAGTLPLLRRKRLEVARALALKPRLLLLDEVGGGLVDQEIDDLIDLLMEVAPDLDGVIIIEHILEVVRRCCSTTMVMNFGKLFAFGAPADILASDDVAAIYLGSAHRRDDARPAAVEAPSTPAALASGLRATVAVPVQDDPAAHLLWLEDVHAGYGQAKVLKGLSLAVHSGETVAILGCNGAGKTTLARTISGVIAPTAGALGFRGQAITGWAPHRIAAAGIAHCMEGRRIFPTLSVEENLLLPARGIDKHTQQERLDTIYSLFPVLFERRRQPGTLMSGGQQQMLAIGRALMSRPALVIFDEISLGLAPVMIDRLYQALDLLKKAGLTMLLVEQDVERSLELADMAHVLSHGRIALSGTPSVLKGDPRLRQLYVGVDDIEADQLEDQ